VADQVDDTVAVTPLVVVPRDKLDEVVVKSNSSLGIKDARPTLRKQTWNNEQWPERSGSFARKYEGISIPAVTNEVGGDQIFLNKAHDPLEVSLRCGPEKTTSVPLLVALETAV
jgi:hypothetical protein